MSEDEAAAADHNTAITEEPGNLDVRIRRTVRRLLDEFVRALGDAGPCVDNGNQIVADELFALARFIDRRGLGFLIDLLDDPAVGTIYRVVNTKETTVTGAEHRT